MCIRCVHTCPIHNSSGGQPNISAGKITGLSLQTPGSHLKEAVWVPNYVQCEVLCVGDLNEYRNACSIKRTRFYAQTFVACSQ